MPPAARKIILKKDNIVIERTTGLWILLHANKPFSLCKIQTGTNNYRSMTFNNKFAGLRFRDKLNDLFETKSFKLVELNI